MFRDREDAGRRLADRLKGRELHNPLVLAIPRGGVATGAVLADELDAELDVVLSRKLRAPNQPELAIGAVSEEGWVFLNKHGRAMFADVEDYMVQERGRQLVEIARRKQLFRAVRPAAPIEGRSVIVTDDGIATGATMIAALQTVRTRNPRELIVAVPVAHPDRLQEFRDWCDELICLHSPEDFFAISQFYEDFEQLEDDQAVDLLRAHVAGRQRQGAANAG